MSPGQVIPEISKSSRDIDHMVTVQTIDHATLSKQCFVSLMGASQGGRMGRYSVGRCL